MTNASFRKEYIMPVVVLLVICLVVAAALAVTHTITEPLIEKINKERADATRALVLPAAQGFSPYNGELLEGVLECYVADNAAGTVITATSKSFGGTLTAMVGVDSTGHIAGVSVIEHKDTPGLGTKAFAEDYLSQYEGIGYLLADKIRNDSQVEAITGATVSSNGVYLAVQKAMQQYELMGGDAQ